LLLEQLEAGAQVFNISDDSFDPKVLPRAFSRLASSEVEVGGTSCLDHRKALWIFRCIICPG
jgi:hypothetical protein